MFPFKNHNINKLVSFLLLCLLLGCVYPQPYYVKRLKNSKPHHKIALLPPLISIGRLPDFIDSTFFDSTLNRYGIIDFHDKEQIYGFAIQDSGRNNFFELQEKYSVSLQPVDTTNAIIARQGITYHQLETYDKSKLCGLLGVDAVLYIRFTGTSGLGSFNRYSMSRSSGKYTEYSFATLHSATDTLWKCNGQGFGFFSGWHNVRLLMRKTIKKLPYRKQ